MPDPATLKAVTDTASYVSVQSDRWLFIALLLVFGLAIYAMAKWFMAREVAMEARVDVLQTRIDAQGSAFNDFLINRHSSMTTIVQKNTEVLEEAVTTLHTAAELLKIASDNIERRKL